MTCGLSKAMGTEIKAWSERGKAPRTNRASVLHVMGPKPTSRMKQGKVKIKEK